MTHSCFLSGGSQGETSRNAGSAWQCLFGRPLSHHCKQELLHSRTEVRKGQIAMGLTIGIPKPQLPCSRERNRSNPHRLQPHSELEVDQRAMPVNCKVPVAPQSCSPPRSQFFRSALQRQVCTAAASAIGQSSRASPHFGRPSLFNSRWNCGGAQKYPCLSA